MSRGFLPNKVIRYAYRPFDVRWLYWEPERKLLDEKRTEYMPHIAPDSVWITANQRTRKSDFYLPQVAEGLVDHHLVESNAGVFPQTLNQGTAAARLNLSVMFVSFAQDHEVQPDSLFFHALSMMHAPIYRTENAGALRQEWPRIPLPSDPGALEQSAELGRRLGALLDIEQDVPGVSSGSLREELRDIAVLHKTGGTPINPDTDDLLVNARWGRGGNGRPVMPGRGRAIERKVSPEESAVLGENTFDIHLNDAVYWENVPERVWDYTLGGYQVLTKWLSYRETSVLGRTLKADEARTFSQIARLIAAILLMEDDLDASYRRCSADTWDWQAAVEATKPQRPQFGDVEARSR